uniref:Uncharacterized protein n=1 Tax=Pyrodinium bahamense TaxID=73915 RepID=A0A7R9ZZN1_9DINO|mmetsp:Transcript_16932/g.46632  ORF Transcript_16932/g.46632 Transcript_16932/m.46632 type:complete len:306 (+) Transcript_16932:94-1011(+)
MDNWCEGSCASPTTAGSLLEDSSSRSTAISEQEVSDSTPKKHSSVGSVEESDYGSETAIDGTDVLSVGSSKQDKAGARKGRRPQTLAEFREQHMKCLEALRKNKQAAALNVVFRQSSEPVYTMHSGFERMSKQVSEESAVSDNISDFIPMNSRLQGVQEDPLVSVVRNINAQHCRMQERMMMGMAELRQDALLQRQELSTILQKQASDIEGLKKRSACLNMKVAAAFAAALGAALGSQYLHGSRSLGPAPAKRAEAVAASEACEKGKKAPAKGSTFVVCLQGADATRGLVVGRSRRAHGGARVAH